MKSHLSIPLRTRLEAWKRGDKTKLGGHWFDEPPLAENKYKGKGWHYVPEYTVNTGLLNGASHHGCWGGTPFKCDGSSTELRFVENLRGYFRNVTPAHDIIKLGYTGWYSDNFQDETCHGIVVQLPARNGEPVYLYGVNDPNNDNTGMIAWRKCEWTSDKEEAARWADDMAKYYAESNRESAAKEQAKVNIEEARERIVEIRTELRVLSAEVRSQRPHLTPPICTVIRRKMKQLRHESHKCWKRITKLEDNYWEAVPQ